MTWSEHIASGIALTSVVYTIHVLCLLLLYQYVLFVFCFESLDLEWIRKKAFVEEMKFCSDI